MQTCHQHLISIFKCSTSFNMLLTHSCCTRTIDLDQHQTHCGSALFIFASTDFRWNWPKCVAEVMNWAKIWIAEFYVKSQISVTLSQGCCIISLPRTTTMSTDYSFPSPLQSSFPAASELSDTRSQPFFRYSQTVWLPLMEWSFWQLGEYYCLCLLFAELS